MTTRDVLNMIAPMEPDSYRFVEADRHILQWKVSNAEKQIPGKRYKVARVTETKAVVVCLPTKQQLIDRYGLMWKAGPYSSVL